MLGLRIGVGVQDSQLRFSGGGESEKEGEGNQWNRKETCVRGIWDPKLGLREGEVRF